MKKNLDKAYEARDEVQRKLAALEEEQRQADIKRLEEEGKHQEAFQKKLETLEKENRSLSARNVELTRDNDVRSALSTLDFRNDKSYEMARRDIVDQLVKADNGVWVHRSGMSIQEYVKSFAEDDGNAFLFKVKRSTGSGGDSPSVSNPVSSSDEPKSLFDLSQEDVITLAAQGKLPHQQR